MCCVQVLWRRVVSFNHHILEGRPESAKTTKVGALARRPHAGQDKKIASTARRVHRVLVRVHLKARIVVVAEP